jgi:hypothetical protein
MDEHAIGDRDALSVIARRAGFTFEFSFGPGNLLSFLDENNVNPRKPRGFQSLSSSTRAGALQFQISGSRILASNLMTTRPTITTNAMIPQTTIHPGCPGKPGTLGAPPETGAELFSRNGTAPFQTTREIGGTTRKIRHWNSMEHAAEVGQPKLLTKLG